MYLNIVTFQMLTNSFILLYHDIINNKNKVPCNEPKWLNKFIPMEKLELWLIYFLYFNFTKFEFFFIVYILHLGYKRLYIL